MLFFLLLTLVSATTPASVYTYNLLNYAEHINGLANCVESLFGIQKPFTCKARCSDFPSMELITTFQPEELFDFSISGFLSVDHEKKQFWHVFRGTATLVDAVSNLRLRPQPLTAAWNNCTGCLAHTGFLDGYNSAYAQFQDEMLDTIRKYPDYQIHVTGHSLGGAAAFLHGIHLKSLNLDPIVITSGQPLTGNQELADYNDELFFGPDKDFTVQGPSRRFYRVTHKDDLIPRIPFWSPFQHSGGEVYIDHQSAEPPLDSVRVCEGQENPECSFSTSIVKAAVVGTLLQAHSSYFTYFSFCGINIGPGLAETELKG